MNRWSAIVLYIFLAGHALAEDDLFSLSLEELGQVSVRIATGTEKPLVRAPAVATVITAEELEAMGAQTLDEALERVPGLHVSRGSFQYAPRYFIRGIVSTYNPHTLFLVNGIPMTSLFLGDRGERLPLQHSLPVSAIERIEIIRGPGSAVYGADAFAGVINIITYDPDDWQQSRARVSTGSYDTSRVSMQHGGKLGEVRAWVSLAWQETGIDRNAVINSDFQSNLDVLFGTDVSRAPGAAQTSSRSHDLRTDLKLGDFRLRGSWMRATDTGTGQGINDALDPDGRFIHQRGSADLTWSDPAWRPDWGLEAQLSYLFGSFENPLGIHLFPEGAFDDGSDPEPFPDGVTAAPLLFEDNVRASFSALYSGMEQHKLRFGTGYFQGDIYRTNDTTNYQVLGPTPTPRPGGAADIGDTPEVFQPEGERSSWYAFVQDEWALAEDWELTSGVRYDHYDDFGKTFNPRVALVWSTTEQLTSKLLYGEAFRAPAFFELYASSNPVALGNPDIRPEKLRSVELAFNWQPDRQWMFDTNFYYLQIRDYIDFVADSLGGTFTAGNVGRIDGYGMEAEVHYQPGSRWQWLANYSHQNTEDQDTGQSLGIAPRDQAYLRAVWMPLPAWQLTPQITWVGKRERQADDPRSDLDGYTSVDLALRWRAIASMDVALIGRNLGNADIREPSRGPGPGDGGLPRILDDLPQQGRSLVAELRARW